MLPIAIVADGETTTSRVAIGGGAYVAAGGGLAGFVVAEPIDHVEIGASASGGGGGFAVGAAGSAFGRYRVDVSRTLSLGMQLSLDAAWVPLRETFFVPSGVRFGAGFGAPLMLRFSDSALYTSLSVGFLYDVGALIHPLVPDLRAASGLVYGRGRRFVFVEAGLSTTPLWWPAPYVFVGLGARL